MTPSLYDAVLAVQRARGLTPQVAQEAIQMQTIVNLVSAGIGMAWVPETVTRLQRPGVVYRRLAGAALQAETSLIWREPALPVVQRFVEQVRESAGHAPEAATIAASLTELHRCWCIRSSIRSPCKSGRWASTGTA